ncbi:transcription termination factor MTERF9, chloroplastic-like [Cornus florida]|uniref:transcription termination factor MTERF9, chloroplastic-like n=1 Tax=Cornus florida TaxID=4283 RepID=UPI00289BE096|nr:transcription termination factor MTERF9, chloroplastic-like [Cornus florida]
MSSMIHFISSRLQHTRHIASIKWHAYLFSTSSVNPVSSSSNSVLNLLKTHGLTQNHIQNLIAIRPQILLADPHKTLKPNIELFQSLGISGTNLVKVLKIEPRVLGIDAHAVVEFFKTCGFSEKQISSLTMKCPKLYLFNAQRNFKPKLEYLKSLGFSEEEIAKILSSIPSILQSSLENQLIPAVQVIRSIVGTNEDFLKPIRAWYGILVFKLEKVLEPNIAILLNHGVPKSLVVKWFMYQPKSLLLKSDRFSEVVREVEKMNFDPTTRQFMLAMDTMAMMSKSLWEQKLGVYSSFGLSEDDIIAAFKLQPMCMSTSAEKIRKLMDFFVNQLKLKPNVISKHPNLLLFSLEKRIVPRCAVLQLLMSRNLIKGDLSLISALRMTETIFAGKFVSKYQNVIPEVIEAHQDTPTFEAFTHPKISRSDITEVLLRYQCYFCILKQGALWNELNFYCTKAADVAFEA